MNTLRPWIAAQLAGTNVPQVSVNGECTPVTNLFHNQVREAIKLAVRFESDLWANCLASAGMPLEDSNIEEDKLVLTLFAFWYFQERASVFDLGQGRHLIGAQGGVWDGRELTAYHAWLKNTVELWLEESELTALRESLLGRLAARA